MQEGELLLGPELGGVERVEVELRVLVVREQLHEHVPLGELLALDGVVEVLGGVVEIGGLDGVGLFLGQVADALARLEVVLDQVRDAVGVHPLVGVDARALHEAVGHRNAPGGEQEGEHVGRFRRVGQEVEEARVGLAVGQRVRLEGVHHVRELGGVADEEDLQVVADEVPVAVLGVELDGESARIAQGLGRVIAVDDGREAGEDGGLLAGSLKELGAGVLGDGLVAVSVWLPKGWGVC